MGVSVAILLALFLLQVGGQGVCGGGCSCITLESAMGINSRWPSFAVQP